MAVSATQGPKGATVKIPPYPNFDQLPIDVATQVIYTQVVPSCEAKKVRLSSEGNHTSPLCKEGVEVYDQKKQKYSLFNVERIQSVFAILEDLFQPTIEFNLSSDSSDFRKSIEKKLEEFISNGEVIVAMLLKGHTARFGKETEGMLANAHFKVSCLKLNFD